MKGLEVIPATDTEPEQVREGFHVYRAVRCPYCNSICWPAETVDVGFGGGSRGAQVAGHHCERCEASEISPALSQAAWNCLPEIERRRGWYVGIVAPRLPEEKGRGIA